MALKGASFAHNDKRLRVIMLHLDTGLFFLYCGGMFRSKSLRSDVRLMVRGTNPPFLLSLFIFAIVALRNWFDLLGGCSGAMRD